MILNGERWWWHEGISSAELIQKTRAEICGEPLMPMPLDETRDGDVWVSVFYLPNLVTLSMYKVV